MGTPTSPSPRYPLLLLLQYRGLVGRALGRFLENYYADVVVVETPEAAEQLLEANRGIPVHLVCSQRFAPGCQLGQELIAAWRHRYPEIRRAVLATAEDDLASNLAGVDGVFEKPTHPSELLNLLGLRDNDCPQVGSFYPPTQSREGTMKSTTLKAHNVSTLKERLVQAPKNDKQSGSLRTAQGFASA